MKMPWWLHLAKLGHSAGAGIAIAASVAQFIPSPYVQFAVGIVSTLAGVVTHYADVGIAQYPPKASNVVNVK